VRGGGLVTVCVPHYNLGRYLGETLAALAAQTYPHLEVLVIDDGSTDPDSWTEFERMQHRYPQFRFFRQDNSGIGATRNRGLKLARGEYFVPVDADNLPRPDMIERFVAAIERQPEVAALTCYFLAFCASADIARGNFLYACRPTAGPAVLASLRNVYGDACAIYRTAVFRAVGGYETDRDTSFEDWEAFVKLVGAGQRVEVIPDHLFHYRHLQTGFSRTTDAHANRERVLRQFSRLEQLPVAERELLWASLAGLHRRVEELTARQRCLRYRVVDWLWCPLRNVTRSLKSLMCGP
jgi:glycosyltransferase involved in cell wall biosynthesis